MRNLDIFPQLYHLHHQKAMEDLSFWHQLVCQHPQMVLELGCGTGRLALNLVTGADRFIGLDKDSAMLHYLSRQLEEQVQKTIELVQADFSYFHFACKYSLIFLACNTYSTISQDGRLKLLSCVHRQLLPQGVFAASMPNPSVLKQLPAHSPAEIEEVLIHPDTGNPLQISSEWERKGTIFTLLWHYDQLFPDGVVERTTHRIQHHLHPSEEYLREIKDSGLSICGLFGDFDGHPYREDSPYLIFVVGLAED